MSATKKYKLFSASSAATGKPAVCAFFSTPAGCRSGDKCTFSHSKGAETFSSGEMLDNTSVVSSESEGVQKKRLEKESPFAKNNTVKKLNKEAGEESKQPKKSKKRKSTPNDDHNDLFASPKITSGNSPKITSGSSPKITSGSLPNKKEDITPAKKQKQAKSPATKTTPRDKPSSNFSADFRNLVSNLPIASFSVDGVSDTGNAAEKKNTPSATPVGVGDEETSSEEEGQLPLPKSTEVGRKWQKALLLSRKHERYATAFDFAKYQDMDEKAGIQSAWIKAQPFGSWCLSNPQAIAIDCEMCETQDPLTSAKNSKALCRLSVVNAEKPEEILLDTLVKPAWPVTDYRTRINGIKKENLDNVEFTLRHAQAFMMALCSEETVIVGHAVHNDLVSLNMEHHCNADSSFLYYAKDSTNASVSLRDLVSSILKKEMPETHDSVNDARKALQCVENWVEKDGNVEQIERSRTNKNHQLFIHRVPKRCQGQHLKAMFLKHTSVEPTDVDAIAFSGETGTTHVTFKTFRHANVAFDTLEGVAEQDKSGRLQKKVYLRNGDYVRVRKMGYQNRGNPNTPKKGV
jgi:RNA exonuclease 1